MYRVASRFHAGLNATLALFDCWVKRAVFVPSCFTLSSSTKCQVWLCLIAELSGVCTELLHAFTLDLMPCPALLNCWIKRCLYRVASRLYARLISRKYPSFTGISHSVLRVREGCELLNVTRIWRSERNVPFGTKFQAISSKQRLPPANLPRGRNTADPPPSPPLAPPPFLFFIF